MSVELILLIRLRNEMVCFHGIKRHPQGQALFDCEKGGSTMKDILLLETCAQCGGNLTLMNSIREPDHVEYLVKRCLNCGCHPVEEVEKVMPEYMGNVSDGYHTFNELYHHRAVLSSVVLNAYHGTAWKSKLHHDGTMFKGMFIVGLDTPEGQATYHYDIDPYWDMFKVQELDRAPEWDGHTPTQAIERIGGLYPGCGGAIAG